MSEDSFVALLTADLRNPVERDFGVIPAAIPMPLAQLRARSAQVPPDKPIVVYCAGGRRSSVAASLLRAQGFARMSGLTGGYTAWKRAHAA